jgi:hypothetical protein
VRRWSPEYVSVDDVNLRDDNLDDNPKDHDIGTRQIMCRAGPVGGRRALPGRFGCG